MNLTALQTKISNDFDKNLNKLELLILNCEEGGFILAPELAVTGYSYNNMDLAVKHSLKAIERLKELSQQRTIALTLMTKKEDNYFNTLHIFHKGQVVHTQSKHQIFVLNEEKDHFSQGNKEDIKIIDIDGLKVAALICFELRFIDLWQQIQGADIILVPAYWGLQRKDNFETLTKALAVANQCYVIASGCADDVCAKSSAIISPLGNIYQDDIKELISKNVDLKEIEMMRKYLDVGIRK